MQDHELLELAAKAAGYSLDGLASRYGGTAVWPEDYLRLNEKGGHSVWNPLRDDGDALRLAVALEIEIHFRSSTVIAWYDEADENGFFLAERKVEEEIGDNPSASTRRAIVRAAAAIGKAMP